MTSSHGTRPRSTNFGLGASSGPGIERARSPPAGRNLCESLRALWKSGSTPCFRQSPCLGHQHAPLRSPGQLMADPPEVLMPKQHAGTTISHSTREADGGCRRHDVRQVYRTVQPSGLPSAVIPIISSSGRLVTGGPGRRVAAVAVKRAAMRRVGMPSPGVRNPGRVSRGRRRRQGARREAGSRAGGLVPAGGWSHRGSLRSMRWISVTRTTRIAVASMEQHADRR